MKGRRRELAVVAALRTLSWRQAEARRWSVPACVALSQPAPRTGSWELWRKCWRWPEDVCANVSSRFSQISKHSVCQMCMHALGR